jgi:aminoglycoside phosphotransferase (APT) family kinase protein
MTTATEGLEPLVAAFAGSYAGQQFPRSRTDLASWRGRRIHLKTSSEDLSVEADALREANHSRTVNGVSALPLVVYDRSRNVLITEYVDGSSLFNLAWNQTALVRAYRRRPSRVAPTVLAVARWLDEYHRTACGDAARRSDCLGWIRRSLDSKLARLREVSPRVVSEASAHLIRVKFSEALEDPIWSSLPVCRIHGDFCHANVIVREDGSCVVVDFGDSRVGFALEDVVRLWASMWEITRCGTYRHRLLSPILPQILSANRLSPPIFESPAFVALRAWNAVTKMLQAAANREHLSITTRSMVSRLAAKHQHWLWEAYGL